MIEIKEKKSISDSIQEVFQLQKQHSMVLRSEPVANRKKRLLALRQWIKSNREAIQEALYKDFKKPSVEVDATEIFPVLDEIKCVLNNLDQWVKPKKVDAPITLIGTRSQIMYEPRGVCLIIGPWNYPFNLLAGPLVLALAAGNTAILKPSEFTVHTSGLIKKMCDELFTPKEVMVFEGDHEMAQALLTFPFDHIFFTGSPGVGKLVMRAASEHLTSVTLELGGKSPTIITPSAKIKEAAQRVAIAKFINNGQTCIAPDYVLVHESIATAFIDQLKQQTKNHFSDGSSFETSASYARIVSKKHFNRVHHLVQDAIEKGASVEMSGSVNEEECFLHPVILTNVSHQAKIMEEEIFGPVLPVLTYQSLDEVIALINNKPKPLALYFFGNNSHELNQVKLTTSAGGMCINDCAIQFLNINVPFGGVNNSGIGKSHGYFGFQAFSHEKSIVKQRHGLTTVKMFYPPYTSGVKRLVGWLLKLT
jgi:aldehyde dehydrogenase (NAD+)